MHSLITQGGLDSIQDDFAGLKGTFCSPFNCTTRILICPNTDKVVQYKN